MEYLVVAVCLGWVALLFVPWRPWGTRERLEADGDSFEKNLRDITVLIPARNEAAVIERTLAALRSQGTGFLTILIDDQSSDGTAALAQSSRLAGLRILDGSPLPAGWTGKLWALEQGWRLVKSTFALLLDADIELEPGVLQALRHKIEERDLVSVMAHLRMETFWERLLVPAFVYFFKLIYPFRLGNDQRSRVGVAAGGCILLRCAALQNAGGFESLRIAIIDDCTLAKKIKEAGGRTWTGLSRSVRSHRAYERLSDFWEMVARTAFTQLRYSVWLLLGTTFLMFLSFWVPLVGLFELPAPAKGFAVIGLMAMVISYLPTLSYYRRSILWAFALPLIGTLYLLMTWSSAIRFWQGKRSEWKGRVYAPTGEQPEPRCPKKSIDASYQP
jgi:hopene-associated glycosyltransferase HpnB